MTETGAAGEVGFDERETRTDPALDRLEKGLAMLLDVNAAGVRLGVSAGKVRAWFAAGKIPGLTLPDGEIRFSPGGLDDWLSGRTGTITPDMADELDRPYRDEFAANRAALERMGVTEEQYVASRRVDDGRATLKPGSAAK